MISDKNIIYFYKKKTLKEIFQAKRNWILVIKQFASCALEDFCFFLFLSKVSVVRV